MGGRRSERKAFSGSQCLQIALSISDSLPERRKSHGGSRIQGRSGMDTLGLVHRNERQASMGANAIPPYRWQERDVQERLQCPRAECNSRRICSCPCSCQRLWNDRKNRWHTRLGAHEAHNAGTIVNVSSRAHGYCYKQEAWSSGVRSSILLRVSTLIFSRGVCRRRRNPPNPTHTPL